jgi:hypothetical protein
MTNFIKTPILCVPWFEFRLRAAALNQLFSVGFEILTILPIRIQKAVLSFFWFLAYLLTYFSTLKMEAILSFESSVIYWTTHHQNMLPTSVFIHNTMIEVYCLRYEGQKTATD